MEKRKADRRCARPPDIEVRSFDSHIREQTAGLWSATMIKPFGSGLPNSAGHGRLNDQGAVPSDGAALSGLLRRGGGLCSSPARQGGEEFEQFVRSGALIDL